MDTLVVSTPSQKVLFMGLGASGKSSIRSVVFEGKSVDDIKDYNATINYERNTKNIIDTNFLLFDCGGQELFISAFVGEQAEFIFSDVTVLIWVVDVNDFDGVSTSKFYFDLAVNRLIEYSPNSIIFCLFHKIDLLVPNIKDEILQTMESYFVTDKKIEIIYRGTSIYDHSVYRVVGEIIQTLIISNTKGKLVNETIHKCIEDSMEILGIAIYNENGLPIFEEGELSGKIILPANLWLANYERLKNEIDITIFKSSLEVDDYFYIFQKIKSGLLLSVIANKIAPLQYIMMKFGNLVDVVNKLL